MEEDMQVDGLTAGHSVPGPKGVAGDFLADMERRALEEQRQTELAEAARKDKGKGKASNDSTEDGGATVSTAAVGGTYVPGSGAGKKAKVSPPTSGIAENASTVNNNGDNNDSTSVPAPPPAKKARVQPTIRMVLTFPGYPPGKEPLAKHVPIFDIHDTAQKHGLLLPVEEVAVDDEASSSGASDDEQEDNEKGEDSNGNAEADETAAEKEAAAEKEPEVTDSQRAMQAALELARKGKKPVIKKKRVLDRDEGYDVDDPFVDDSEMLVDEPKFQPTPKIEGYCAIVGPVETVEDDSSNKGKQRGRKFGSVNKPKVTVVQADGTTKLVSEAVAAKEAKRNAKLAASENNEVKKQASASESPAPQQAAMASTSTAPASTSTVKHPSSSRSNSAQQIPVNPKGPLMSKDAVMYSHLPSSTAAPSSPPLESSPGPPHTGHGRSKSVSQTPSNVDNGSRMSPINLDEGDGDTEMQDASMGDGSRVMSSTPAPKPTNVFAFNPSPEKGAKKYEYDAVSTPVEAALAKLRKVVAKESFIPKSKFPQYIKPMLVDVAILAMKHGEYDDNFFNIMPNIFPYNRFTMVKLIKREVCDPRCEMLEEEIAQSIKELSAEANKTLPTLKAEYDAKVKVWEKEMEEWKANNQNKASGAAENGQAAQRAHSLTPVGSDGDTSAAPAAAHGEGPEKPKPKFKFNDSARMHLWRIMTMSSEITDRKTEKAEVEKQEPPSAMNATKARYQELTKIWPEGWVTSNQLSREMTAAKKKIEKTMNAGAR